MFVNYMMWDTPRRYVEKHAENNEIEFPLFKKLDHGYPDLAIFTKNKQLKSLPVLAPINVKLFFTNKNCYLTKKIKYYLIINAFNLT